MLPLADAPNATDWITADTGVAALVVATAAAVVALIQFGMLLRNNRRDQAAKFGVWTTRHETDHALKVLYANGSGLPVYNVKVTVIAGTDTSKPHSVGTCGPTTEPGDLRIGNNVMSEIGPLPSNDWEVTAEVTFRDAKGNDWRRDSTGKLTRG